MNPNTENISPPEVIEPPNDLGREMIDSSLERVSLEPVEVAPSPGESQDSLDSAPPKIIFDQPKSPGGTRISFDRPVVVLIFVLVSLVLTGLVLLLLSTRDNKQDISQNTDDFGNQTAPQLNLDGQNGDQIDHLWQVDVNGRLRVNNSFIISPTAEPENPQIGQMYFNEDNSSLYLYNGEEFVNLGVDRSLVGIDLAYLANASNISSGELADVRLSQNVTLQGNDFNKANSLLRLNGSGEVDTSLLTDSVALLDRNSQIFSGNNQVFRNSANSTTAFRIQNASGSNNLFVADTTNGRIAVGQSSANYTLDVNGDINIASASAYKIGGVDVCTSLGCITGSSSGILNQNASDQTADFRISGTGRANTSILTPLLDTAAATTLSIGTNNATSISLDKDTVVSSGNTFSAYGAANFMNSTNSTTAFQVQNAGGEQLLVVDTSTTNNLITNSNFEVDASGWVAKGNSTISQTTSQKHLGNGSVAVDTTALANDGARYDYALASQTMYTMTFYAKTSGATYNTSSINVGRTEDGSTDKDCATDQTIHDGGWNKLTCTFVTGNVTGSNHVYIKQTDAADRIFYIDSVQLQTSANLVTNPDIEVDTAGWLAVGPPSITQTASQSYTGSGSLMITTDASGGLDQGAAIDMSSAEPNTTYTASFWIKLDAGVATSEDMYLVNFTDPNALTDRAHCASVVLTPGGAWTNLICTFTTGSGIAPGAWVGVTIRDDTVSGPKTFYIDNAAVSVTKWDSNDIGRISLNGIVVSPLIIQGENSSTAFQVKQSDGVSVLTVDTANNGVGINVDRPTATFQVQDTAGNDAFVVDSVDRQISIASGWGGDLIYAVDTPEGFSGVAVEPASVITNGYMYILGGGASTVEFGKINANGTVTGITTTTSLPVSKSRTAAVIHNGYLYAIGGGTSNTVYYNRVKSDGSLGSWNSTTSLTTSGHNHSAVVYNGYVYVVSSGSGNPVIHAKLNADGTIGSWTTSQMTGGDRPQLAVVNSKLYEFDGNYTGTVRRADIGVDGTLSNITTGGFDLPNLSYKTRAVAMNGYLYAFTDDGFNGTTQIYYSRINFDGTIGSWNKSLLSEAGLVDSNHAITAYNGYIYANGGRYFATQRTRLSGALDLVALADQDTAGGGASGVGASLTAGNTNIVGSLNVLGQTALGQGLSVAGDLNVGGQAMFRNTDGGQNHFIVQNAGGVNSLVLNTVNLIKNSSFEYGVTNVDNNVDDWTKKGSPTSLERQTTQSYFGSGSMEITTGTTVDRGAKYNIQLAPSTQYTLSFYAKISTGSFNTLAAGRSDDGSTDTACTLNSNSINTSWARYSCTFTTGATITGTPHIYITKGSDGSSRIIYIDGVQLETGSSATGFRNADLTVDAQALFKNTANSATSFQIQNASGTSLLVADTANMIIRPGVIASSSSFTQTSTEVDNTNNVGLYSSIVIGTDSLPIIAYTDTGNTALRVTKCGNTSCSSGNTSTEVDNTASVGNAPSIAIGTDGLPVISYFDTTNTALNVVKCGNTSCSSGSTITQVDNTNSVGTYSSIAIGTDGLPVISYRDTTNTALRVTKCGNASCSSGNTSTEVDNTADVGYYTSIAIGTDGLPVISYYDTTNTALRVTKCGNASCSSGNTSTELDTNNVGLGYTSIAIGTDGLPIMSYYYTDGATEYGIMVARCHTDDCAGDKTTSVVELDLSLNNIGQYSSIAIGADGLPIVSYSDSSNGNLKVAKCQDMTCEALTVTIVESTNSLGDFNSLVIGADGIPVISYYDLTNTALRVTKCANSACSSTSGSVYGGGISLGSISSSFQSVYFDTLNLGKENAKVSLDQNGTFVANALKTKSDGTVTFGLSNSTTAFQIQNASSQNLFQVDTSNNVVAIGGNNSAELQTWASSANTLSPTLGAHSTVTHNGYIYIIGGYSGSGLDFQRNIYYSKLNSDGSNGTWTTASNALPVKTGRHSSVVVNGYLYVIGGTSDNVNSIRTVRYAKLNSDGSVGTWATTANLGSAAGDRRWDAATVAYGGYIYVIGGSDDTNSQDEVFYAKPNADGTISSWSTESDLLPASRFGMGAVAANGYIYAYGGGDGSTSYPETYYAKINADPSTGTAAWNTDSDSSLNTSRYLHGAVVSNGYIYAIGGATGLLGATAYSSVEYAKLNSDGTVGAWTVATNSLLANRFFTGAAIYNGYIYIPGGVTGTITNNANYVSTVYYASTQRIKFGGNLDLTSYSGGNGAEGNGSGGSLTAGNTNIVGYLQVAGSASFAQGVSVGGELNVTGNTALGTGLVVSKVADSGSAVAFTLGTEVSYATTGAKLFVVNNATNERFSIDKDGHIVTYGHIKSTQTTAPTIGTPTNCGTTPTSAVTAASTDSAGSFTITTGSGALGAGTCDTVITFNRAYGTAPKSVIVMPKSGVSTNKTIYVSATTTTTFTVIFGTAATVNTEANDYYYWVVE